jgi:DNA-binding transcriptional ArsR family regulator
MEDRAARPYPIVSVEFAIEPVHNLLGGLAMLHIYTNDWVQYARQQLTSKQLFINEILLQVLANAVEPAESWDDFSEYIQHFAGVDVFELRDKALSGLPNGALEHFDLYAESMRKYHDFDDDVLQEAHRLLRDPHQLQHIIIGHLSEMWTLLLEPFWQTHQHKIQQQVARLQQNQYLNMTGYEAIRAITKRDITGTWQNAMAEATVLRFVPSYQVAPYLLKYRYPELPGLVRIVFGVSDESQRGQVDRQQLLDQLRVLTDENRLSIIELLIQHRNLCAQDIIALLDISQSTVSRHLSQLVAQGFIEEYQQDGKTKCYRLNRASFRQVLQNLADFTDANGG